MGRLYVCTTGFQSVGTAAQDLIEIKAGANDPFVLHFLAVSQSSDAGDSEAEMAELFIKRASGAYTSGSGGGALVVENFRNLSDAADSFAAETRNNTTQATGGTIDIIWEEAFNVQAGWQFLPPPEMRPYFNSSEGLILSIGTTADALTMSAMALVEELG